MRRSVLTRSLGRASVLAIALGVASGLGLGLGVQGAARADEPDIASLDGAVKALRARILVTELDVAEAEKVLEGADPADALLAVERARARLWRLDCEGASAILSRPDLEGSKESASLLAVARGCLRGMAGTVLVEDEERGVVVRFQDDEDRALAPVMIDVAARSREFLAKDLGVTLPRPIYVEVVRDQHTLAAMTGLPLEAAATTGTVAVAKWGRVIMLSPRAAPGGYPWLDTLAHELTHMALTRGSRDRAPLWLQEGVAKREETRWRLPEPFDDRPPADDLAAYGLAASIGPPIDAIGPSIAMLPSAEEAMVTYAKVQSFIGFFADTAGDQALPKLVEARRDATAPDDLGPAVEKASGATFTSWKEKWEARLKEVGRELPPDQKPGAPPPAGWAEARRRVRLGDLLEGRDHHEAARRQRSLALGVAGDDARVRAGLASSLRTLGDLEGARAVVANEKDVRMGGARWWSLRGVLVEGEAARGSAAALARDPLEPSVACEEKKPPELPADPVRAAVCQAARRVPRGNP